MVTPKSPWSNKLAPKTIPNPAKNTTFPETNTTPGNSWKMKCRDSLCSGAMLVLGRVIGGFNHPIEQYSRQLGTPNTGGEDKYLKPPTLDRLLNFFLCWFLEVQALLSADVWNQPWPLVQLFFGEAAHICLHQSQKSPLNKPPTPKVQDNTIVLDNLWQPFLWSYGPIKEGSVTVFLLGRMHISMWWIWTHETITIISWLPICGGGSTWTTPFHKGAMFFF